MTHYNDRLRGGVDIVGISNFVTFLESTAEYRRDLRRAEYGDERDPKMRAFLREDLAAQQRGQDQQADAGRAGPERPARARTRKRSRWSPRIRANGGEVWYLVGLNEGHGFAKRDNIDYYQWAVAMFLEKLKQ